MTTHATAIQREIVSFVQYVLFYKPKTLFGIESLNALPTSLLSGEIMVQLTASVPSRFARGAANTGAPNPQGKGGRWFETEDATPVKKLYDGISRIAPAELVKRGKASVRHALNSIAGCKVGEGRLPDFIIVGAMKAGTTSLHYILNRHENIFIPRREIYFFDLDDIQQHPDFFIDDRGKWVFHDYENRYKDYLDWYSGFFQNAIDGQLIGEDSTTYMASSRAAPRIAKLLPKVKLIFMLRDPVTRAYSHYWHLVNSGRAIYGFEDTLRHAVGTIIQRGFYKEQIERFMQYLPKDQLKFIIFEEFTKNIQATVDDVCEFLGLDGTIETSAINTHRNRTTTPRSLGLKLTANRLNRKAAEHIYRGYIPTSGIEKKQTSIFNIAVERLSPTRVISKIASFHPRPKYPPMAHGVREFLEQLYAKENRGLAELIGIDIERHWPYIRHHG